MFVAVSCDHVHVCLMVLDVNLTLCIQTHKYSDSHVYVITFYDCFALCWCVCTTRFLRDRYTRTHTHRHTAPHAMGANGVRLRQNVSDFNDLETPCRFTVFTMSSHARALAVENNLHLKCAHTYSILCTRDVYTHYSQVREQYVVYIVQRTL